MKSVSSRRNTAPAASNSSRWALSWTAEEATEIIEACKNDDSNAQHRLYDVSHHSIYRLVVRMVGLQDAADVTQQVFLQVFRKINQFAGKSQFSTWLYRVTINETLQHLRKAKRSRSQGLKHEPADYSPDDYKNIEDQELLELALARLEPDLRATFLLREIDGLSYDAIAVALSIPEGTVGSRLNRARQELKAFLTELGWEP